MEATNDNKLETYAPFETVNPFIYNLVYNQQIIDLTFAQLRTLNLINSVYHYFFG